MLKAKIAVFTTIAPSLLFASLHYAAHGYVKIEGAALDTLDTYKELVLDRLESFRHPTKEIGAKLSTIQDVVRIEAKKHNIKPELIESIIEVESNWKTNAIRYEPHLAKGPSDQDRMNASSHGLMQILPLWCGNLICPDIKTWADLYNPIKNIRCGTSILAQALKQTGSVKGALVAYNGGLSCSKNPVCLAQANQHAAKVMQVLAEKMIQNG